MSHSHLHTPLPQQTTYPNQRGLDIYPVTNHDGSPSTETIELTIRFSTSLADLPLSLPLSSPTHNPPTTATLKQHIRTSLPSSLKHNRLRLIHAGKALDDAVPLTTSLKRFLAPPPPRTASAVPSRISTPGPYDSGSESDAARQQHKRHNRDAIPVDVKGKTPVRDPPLQQRERIYIHCSIGDVALTEEELAAEEALASTQIQTHGHGEEERVAATSASTTTAASGAGVLPAPRGFDRLLAAGFTASEVHALRLQFVSVQAHTHTPETMPSPNTLRALEDQWLDDSSGNSGGLLAGGSGGDSNDGGGGGGGAGSGSGSFDESGRGALDDMIWGTTMGFFWPIGCVIWGTRETGIFSPRRKIAIVIGLVLNLGLGFVRWGG